MHSDLNEILRSLDLPPSSRKIYTELLQGGETTVRMLSERLSLTRPSTYDHIAILKKKGLIIEKKIGSKSFFAIDDMHHVGAMLEESIDKLSKQKEIFTTLLPELLKQSHTESPTIKFFEGKLGLTHLLNDILHSGTREVFTMWPYEEMLRVLGKETLVRFNNRRMQEKIFIHTLWPGGKKMSNDYIWDGKDTHTERRQAKKGVGWNMGYTIYGNKVSFISSHKEVYGFIVSSKDFAELMRVQFDALWRESEK
jgi:sugar-specific transcriptional regulator TrmB